MKKRETGIEVLRIICILGVILLHFNERAFELGEIEPVNKWILQLLEVSSIHAVNSFMVISGYFMINNNTRSIVKPVELVFKLVLCTLVGRIIVMLISGQSIGIGTILYLCIPKSYFITLYVVVYIISPWINLLMHNIANKSNALIDKFIICIFILFSCMPTFADLVEEIIGHEIMGINTIGAYGSGEGFTIVEFVLAYCLGAYIKLRCEKWLPKKMYIIMIFIISTLVLLVWSRIGESLFVVKLSSALEYCNPLILVQSISLVFLFKNLSISIPWVNCLAKSVFMCYLTYVFFLEAIDISSIVSRNCILMVSEIVLVSVVIFLICFILEKIYNLLFSKLFTKIDDFFKNNNINYLVNI